MDNRTKNIWYSLLLLAVITSVFYYRKYTQSDDESQPQEQRDPRLGPNVVRFSGQTMGSYYGVQYLDSAERIQQGEVDSILEDFNAELNTYVPDSRLAQLNASGDSIWEIGDTKYLLPLIKKSTELYQLSEGAYDPSTVAALKAWGFLGNKEKQKPKPAVLDSAKAITGWDKIEVRAGKVYLPAGMQLSFNASAPGYAADVVADYFDAQGLEDYYVDIGGEIVCKGKSPRGDKWRVGIEKPLQRQQQNPAVAFISVDNQALATSGNYRNFFEQADSTYGHTFDPAARRPVQNAMRSATVLAQSGLWADALATACMVHGKEWALDLAAQQKDVQIFVLFEQEGKIEMAHSDGLGIDFP